MNIDTNTIVSMTEANQNFSQVARTVDKYGQAIIFKNNAPRYKVTIFSTADTIEYAATDNILDSAKRMMDKYDETFKELAK